MKSIKMYATCLDIHAEEIMKGFYIVCSMLNLTLTFFFEGIFFDFAVKKCLPLLL